eukprot:13567493-Ditylum_brightwellii.AAC.1
MVAGDHLEMDDSVVLGDEDRQSYQMLIGHKDRALYVVGYLKKKPNQRIEIDSHDPIVVKNDAEGQLQTDFLAKMKEQYLHAIKMLNDNVPDAILDKL